jgi:hypothetical protein
MANGWKYAPKRNDTKKLHPDLVHWDVLREESREKDRDAIRNLESTYEPALADMGLQIVRLG